MKCLSCQTDNIEGAKFCRKCGGSLIRKIVCPECKHRNPCDSKFCEECKYDMSKVPTEPDLPSIVKLPSSQFAGAEHKPLAYPGRRPDFSFVYFKDMIYRITPGGDSYDDLELDGSNGRIKLDKFLTDRGNGTMAERKAVLAVGSNGCPGRLAEKYADQQDAALPVFMGTMVNTVIVYSRRFADYWALPATYLYQPGAVSKLSVIMLTKEQLALMDKTEGIGEFYLRIAVPGYFRVDNGPMLPDLSAYLSREIITYRGNPIRVKMFAKDGPDWPIMSEPEVLKLVFNEAGLLKDKKIVERRRQFRETVERHRQLCEDEGLKEKITKFLDKRMSKLDVDKNAQLVERARPSITCSRIIRTDTRPCSEGTYIVRLSQANSDKLKVRNKKYVQVRYGNSSVLACLSIDKKIDKDMDSNKEKGDETIRMDQKLRTAIGLEPILQGLDKDELIYSRDEKKDLRYPIVIQRAKFKGPNPLTKLLKQQYLICVVHNAFPADMETPIVRLTTRAMQVIGVEPGERVHLISHERNKTARCLPLDPKFQLPTETMETTFADWKYQLPRDEALRLPWITMDRQTRLALDVKPWQTVLVGRNARSVLASEFSQVALALAIPALGGAIIFGDWRAQLGIVLAAFFSIMTLIWLRIRTRI